MIYYENGPSYINADANNSDTITSFNIGDYVAVGYLSYLSEDMNSDIIAIPFFMTMTDPLNVGFSGVNKGYKAFEKSNPIHQKLFDSLDHKDITYNSLRSYVRNYIHGRD